MTAAGEDIPREAVPFAIHGNTWEEMTVGTAFRTAARTVTESDLTTFVNLCGFNEPLFFDARHASEGVTPAAWFRVHSSTRSVKGW